MDVDDDSKFNLCESNNTKIPVITSIEWIDNGKITFSFRFNAEYKHCVKKYELYYCYINDNDNNWYKYASNNWRTIIISSSDNINDNVELRIATNKDIYDENKNERIELILKMRCELKTSDWKWHTFYSEFSNIYFVKSLSIPHILNKQTHIFQILATIFDITHIDKQQENDENKKAKARQKLLSLYKKYKNHFGVNMVFTKLLNKQIENYYKYKYSKSLLSSNNTLSKYLHQIENSINYETQNLFPYIDKYCNDNDTQNMISIIVNQAFECKAIKQVLENKDNGILHLFIELIYDQQEAIQDLDRLLMCCNYLKVQTKTIIEQYFCDSIRNLFITEQHSLNKTIFDIHKNILNVIKNKLQNKSMYYISIENGINDYLDILIKTQSQSDNYFDLMIQRASGNDANSHDAKQDISLFCKICSSIPDGNKKVSQLFNKYIVNRGLKLIEKNKQCQRTDHHLIRALIDTNNVFLQIIEHQLESKQIFYESLKEAFVEIMSKEYYISALLARFTNDILKKGTTTIPICNLEDTMNSIVRLYGCIRDKDIFERDCQQYLASRLLQDLSETEQAERSMIGYLKAAAPYNWTSKLEDMFKDIQRSKELMTEYKDKYKSIYNENEIDLNISICTTGAWPTSSIQTVKKSQHINMEIEQFTQFYLKRFSGRRLNFQMDKGKADVSIQFNTKTKKILIVSTYQMLVLLLFNDNKTWTFKEIQDGTAIPKEDLQVALLSLAHPKVKVLRKSPYTKEVADDHKFEINSDYTNPRSKISIPTLSISSPKQEEKIDSSIFVQRRHAMDEAIVRCVKPYQRLYWMKRPISHQDLVAAVVKYLRPRFTPKTMDIKKRITTLIDLEYIERDENDRLKYWYKI